MSLGPHVFWSQMDMGSKTISTKSTKWLPGASLPTPASLETPQGLILDIPGANVDPKCHRNELIWGPLWFQNEVKGRSKIEEAFAYTRSTSH